MEDILRNVFQVYHHVTLSGEEYLRFLLRTPFRENRARCRTYLYRFDGFAELGIRDADMDGLAIQLVRGGVYLLDVKACYRIAGRGVQFGIVVGLAFESRVGRRHARERGVRSDVQHKSTHDKKQKINIR